VLDLALRDVEQQALDDVADMLHVDRELDDVGPAARLVGLECLAADLRQVALDRRIQAVDLVVPAPQGLGEVLVAALQHRHQADQHLVHGVGQPDRLARGVAERQRRRVERDGIQVLGPADSVRLALRGPALVSRRFSGQR
jgi:hypothetical protein